MKKILNLKVSAWPLLGMILVGGMIYSLVAWAAPNDTLAQKQFNALASSGALVTANNQYQLIAGSDGTNIRPILTSAAGAIAITAGAGGFTPADGVANPTGLLGAESFGMIWTGATWSRLKGDASVNLMVSLGTALDQAIDDITTYEFLKTSVATFQLNCGNPATQLTSTAGKSVTIAALAANASPVYIGASGVIATTGHELVQSASYSDAVDNANRFYCFSTAGTQDISVIVTN